METLEETQRWRQDDLDKKVDRVLWTLRHAADEIEREYARCKDLEYQKRYKESTSKIRHGVFAAFAENALRSVLWAISNAHIDSLPLDAAELDKIVAELEALEPPETEDAKLEASNE